MLKFNNFAALLLLLPTIVAAQVPDGYYSSADGLTGEALKTELYQIIDDHQSESYSDLWTDFQTTDDKPNGKVWDMYSDVPGGTPSYEYTFGTHQCGNYSSEGDCYNREHSFPKSWFDDASPMYTDLFHVVPSDGYVNGKRNNYPYGETNSPSWTSMNGSKKGPCSYPGYTGTIFEPIDEYKGDFARSYFYMVTRYENLVAAWESNASGADAMLNGTSYPAFEDWSLSMLMEWHSNDPVSEKEIDRNNAIHDIQNNRNPFIDHPEYVDAIWGDPDQNTPPQIANIETIPQTPDPNSAVEIKASITDQLGTIISAETKWGLSSGSLTNTLAMTDNGSYYLTSSSIPAQNIGTTVYYQLSATDDSSATTTSDILSYTVQNKPDTILEERFSSCPPENWITKDLGSSENWSCTGEFMDINAYDGDAPCNDWLITPSFNPNQFTNETLTFATWTEYADSYYPPLEVKYSTNYTSGEDPSTATWQTLSTTLAPENSQSWTASGDVDLSQIDAEQIHLAFHYTSSGSGAGTSAWWKVDNVLITGSAIPQDQHPEISNVYHSPEQPAIDESVTVHATVTDDESVAEAELLYGTNSAMYNDTLQMNQNGDIFTQVIPGQGENTTIYYAVKAFDNNNQASLSEEHVISYPNVNDKPVIDTVYYTPEQPGIDHPITVYSEATDDEAISKLNLYYGKATGIYEDTLQMQEEGALFHQEIPGQGPGTIIYLAVEAFDNAGQSDLSQEFQVNYPPDYLKPKVDTVIWSPLQPDKGEGVAIYATIKSGSDLERVELFWGTTSQEYTNQQQLSPLGGYYKDSISGNSAIDTIYFMVEAENASDTVAQSQEYMITYQGNQTGITPSDRQRFQATIFPNPATDHLHIQFEKPVAITEIKLIDLTGKIHVHRTFKNARKKNIRLSTEMFPRGTYILLTQGQHLTFQHKVIIR